MPQAIKDAASAVGFPTTYGSPLMKSQVARSDSVMVERVKAAGCIVIGKTNMPEFGLGSHTYNNLFGVTGNAWDRRLSTWSRCRVWWSSTTTCRWSPPVTFALSILPPPRRHDVVLGSISARFGKAE